MTLAFINVKPQSLFATKCRENVGVSATRVILAMRRYQVDKRALPAKLDDLVPTYLDAVPLDDFDGRPLRYAPKKKVVYSVGPDLSDDGGRELSNDWAVPFDIVYPVGF